ncbi:MAG: site-specific integrase [Christensenella sp.]|nr:site-specific integrase [Christensenella sp.]
MSKSKDKSLKRGNPFQRGKTWTYRIYVSDPQTGKKYQKWMGGFSTEKEAKTAMETAKAQLKLGLYLEPCKQTVAEYMTEWFENEHRLLLKPSTIRGYEANIRLHIIPSVGYLRLDKLCRSDVQKMCNGMQEKGFRGSTIKYALRVLSACMNDAVLNDLILKTPCKKILIRSEKYHATVLSKRQISVLLDGAIDSPIYTELLLTATLGLRRGELLGLKFSDFDFHECTVHIQRQITETKVKHGQLTGQSLWGESTLKTESSNRILPVAKPVLEAVRARQRAAKTNCLQLGADYHNEDYVCCNERGEFLKPPTLNKRFKNLLNSLGLPAIRFHDLRHSFATLIVEEHVPIKTVSHLLGHSNISTTADIYSDVINSPKEAALVVERCFFPQGISE